VRSRLPLARRRPSGLKAIPPSSAVWPRRTRGVGPGRSVAERGYHSRTVPSQLAVASLRPSALRATLVTMSSWPRNTRLSRLVARSQIFTVLSQQPAIRRCPSGLNTTRSAALSTPCNSCRFCPVVVSHSVKPRAPAEAMRWPSGRNARLMTRPECPRNCIRSAPVRASQIRTRLSTPHEASRRPSGLKATHVGAPAWPR
jgi:hypothetical protein